MKTTIRFLENSLEETRKIHASDQKEWKFYQNDKVHL